MERAYEDIKQGEIGAWISIAAYLCLAALKLAVGLSANSEALTADGLNNSTDIIASVAVLIGLRLSRKPPDKDHRYGHFRAETVAALAASFIMFGVGLQVLYTSVTAFQRPSEASHGSAAAWTALFSAIAIFAVYLYNVRLAKRIQSAALMAAAQDNRSDALVSIGAFVGIIGSSLGLSWLDPLTALLVGLMICKTAWGIFRDAAHALTDGFDDQELQAIRSTVRDVPGVEKIIDMKARMHGSYKLVDVTIGVHHLLTVTESHDITEHVEKQIYDSHQISHVHIHIEPYSQTSKKHPQSG
ncbi:cation diffusion facilitator family transporter [Paenibacillus sp. R14(2021)]|uniref:cation diffusion facilitator family transporter n=1 Tax=Paenibacillus sp. R14(2021) TaxID=2859228 RepID=UPI001C614CF2|nr:cation diffusion facilitator family transporter [Paenibacillus sp. R14(2021)]